MESLIITQDASLSSNLRKLLEDEGWQTIGSNTVSPARKLLNRGLDLVVLDEASLTEAAREIGPEIAKLEKPPGVFAVLSSSTPPHTPDLSPDAYLSSPVAPAAPTGPRKARQRTLLSRHAKDSGSLGRHPASPSGHRSDRPHPSQRPDHRRERNGKEPDCGSDPRSEPTRIRPLLDTQLRIHPRDTAGKRVVWPRTRRLYRCQNSPRGNL